MTYNFSDEQKEVIKKNLNAPKKKDGGFETIIKSLKKKQNRKITATSTINPLTKRGYDLIPFSELGLFEDPLQVHLQHMERRNPSVKYGGSNYQENISSRSKLFLRKLQRTNQIYRVSDDEYLIDKYRTH